MTTEDDLQKVVNWFKGLINNERVKKDIERKIVTRGVGREVFFPPEENTRTKIVVVVDGVRICSDDNEP